MLTHQDVAEGRAAALPSDDEMKKGGFKFLYEVWSYQPDGFFCTTIRPLKGKQEAPFIDLWFMKRDGKFHAQFDKEIFLDKRPYDWYWAPCGFSDVTRKKKTCLPSRVMFADLDWVPPHEVPMTPAFSWETSPGKWQCIWFSSEFLEPVEFDMVNKALNRACGADPGTWNRNRILRVPGSDHLKAQRNS